MLVGDLVVWFYEDLAGIAPDPAQPGFRHIVMRPHLIAGLDYVKAGFRSPCGMIRSEWRNDEKTFDWRITIPANTTATVYVPGNAELSESGKPVRDAQGVKLLRNQSGGAVLEIGSGEYHFSQRRSM
jgi:alpha-L-rhamnosidase